MLRTMLRRVTGLVLRGICLMRPQEIDWMYRPGGASLLKPVAWANFVEGLPTDLRQGDVLSSYLQLLTSPDAATRDRAVRGLPGCQWRAVKAGRRMCGAAPP